MTLPFKSVVAVSQNGVIGRKGDLPWKLPEDLKWFKKITMGGTVIMGRKTWQSLPFPLPGRKNWVISRTMEEKEGMRVFRSIEDVKAELSIDDDAYVIGGGEIYSQTLSDCSEIFLTEVLCEVPDGDAFFPDITDSFVVAEILEENEDFILRRWVRNS